MAKGKITAQETGRAGGISRARKLTAAERKRIAQKASRARWKNQKEKLTQ